MTIDTERLRQLRQLATDATPGPWGCFHAGWRFDDTLRLGSGSGGPVNGIASTLAKHSVAATFTGAAFGFDGDINGERDKQAERDAAFIAAANPATVLALLDENDRLSILLRDALAPKKGAIDGSTAVSFSDLEQALGPDHFVTMAVRGLLRR